MLLDRLTAQKKFCSGCGACYNACPVDAISMSPDAQGFYYPSIDERVCIRCGKCEHVCPKLNTPVLNTDVPTCYAARAQDDIRAISSSGGIFTLLARSMLHSGGVVCGATMEEDYSVHHICVKDENGLARLRKSKYVQSDVGMVYREIASHLKAGRRVLFSGTPCQVAAARNIFGAENDSVFYVDILCHGVPSVKMWQDYVHENFDLTQLQTIEFRSKLNGWRAEQLRAFWKDGTSSCIPWPKSAYEEGFQRNICLRDGCEDCEFCGSNRQGDLTLGDFWRVELYDPKLNDHRGTSVVLVNNARGERMLNDIRAELLDLTPTPFEAARHNRVKTSFAPHPMKARFKTLYPGKTFTEAVMQCRHSLYDIGLVANYLIENYGAHLTQYALYRTLTEMGYSVLMIERPSNAPEPPPRQALANLFEKPPYPTWANAKIMPNIAEMKFFNLQCKVFVTGSDQMFNNNLFRAYGKIMCQNFVTDNHRKIAYAASFGHARIWGSERDRAAESFFMQRFDAFSVREDSGVELCRREFGVEATWVLDPVFLCPMKEYERLANAGKRTLPKSPYLFAYILDPTQEKGTILRNYASLHNLDIRAIVDIVFRNSAAKMWDINTLSNVKIEGWLAHIANSDFFVTDSFHGMCFAILFRKQFVVICNKDRGETRFTSLMGLLGLKDRLAYTFDDVKRMLGQLTPINYDKVYETLNAERVRSKEWLRSAIESDRDVRRPFSTFDMLDARCDDLCRRFDQRLDEQARLIKQLQAALAKQGVMLPPPPTSPLPKASRTSWLLKKVHGGIRCVRENGWRYTIKHGIEKIQNKVKR